MKSNDKQEVEPTPKGLKAVEVHLGKAEGLLADAGYFSADNVKQCEAAEIVPYISDHRERHNRPWGECAVLNKKPGLALKSVKNGLLLTKLNPTGS